MDLHQGETILFDGHPSWRSVLGFYIKWALAAVVVGGIIIAIGETAIGIAAFAVIETLAIVIGFFKRASTRYVITNERLHIRRGLLSKATQETRIERVQNVNTDQSFLERILQVGTVDFDTAGTDDSDFTFDGVSEPDEVVQAVEKARRTAAARPDVAGV